MNCLYCKKSRLNNISWENFLLLNEPFSLCSSCRSSLTKLSGHRCQICSRMSHHSECYDCKRWKNLGIGNALTSNYSIYHYTTSIKELIAKWKYRGDYILGEIFRSDMKAAFHSLQFKKDITIVPIPLSKERLQERAFNQAEMLASFLPVQTVLALKRTDGEKQSKKDRQARLNAPNPFIVTKEMKKPVLLIDDIYTTGTTLRHAAYSLKQQGCPAVYSLTLIRG